MLTPVSYCHSGLLLEVAKQRPFGHTRKSRPLIQVAFIVWFLRYLFHKTLQSWIARHWEIQGLVVGVLYLVAENSQKMPLELRRRRVLLPLRDAKHDFAKKR